MRPDFYHEAIFVVRKEFALFGLLLCFALCGVLVACSNSEGILESSKQDGNADEYTLEGMLRVNSEGAIVLMGTNDSLSKANERPEMRVSLDYKFFIGLHEVTCAEFDSLMKPATGLSLECDSEKWPATNVSYFDAVLFANARSKAEGFDTVYTYASAVFDGDRHCTDLEGFFYNSDVDGYRLPTEAEWTYVAGLNWNVDSSWTLGNSENRLHDVCSIGAVDSMPCDMAGNAMEWMNDWLGNFRDTLITNYVGAPDGGSLGQRVVKGGSFRNEAGAITLRTRGDVYTVTSSMMAGYVGFRLAFGKIPGAVWMGSDGNVAASRIVPVVKSSKVRSLTGTFRTKLAFRNDLTGNLAFIDYSSGLLSVIEIEDSIEVYHPDISPDGRMVAFCTGLEGVSGKSSLYVRDLNDAGTNLVKLDVESAAIPRWRVHANGDTVIVYVTDAGDNREESSFKKASTWQVKFANGKFGEPEKLFDGAFHGGISDDNTLAVTGARLLRARIAESGSTLSGKARDELWYDGEQACNASLAKDGSKRTLFLDFGGDTGRRFVGKDYDTHERILIVDSTGRLTASVGAPASYTFDHSEWVSGGNLAVATLVSSEGVHQKIVLVDLSDGSEIDLAYGTELWHPALWVSKPAATLDSISLDLDSAGIYIEQDSDPLLSHKMNIFWNYADSLKVIALGSSRMSMGFVSTDISYGKAFNMASIPSDMDISHYLAKNYIFNHCGQLEILVLGIDFDLWSEGGSVTIAQNLLSFPGYRYDVSNNFWTDHGADEMKALNRTILEENAIARILEEDMGWISGYEGSSWTNGGLCEDAIVNDSAWSDSSENYMRNMYELEEIVEMAANRGVHVIGVIFPQSPYYKETGAYGRHGMRRSHAMRLMDEIENIGNRHPNFTVMDENRMGDHDYGDSLAYDYDHLNALGAKRLTSRIDSLIQTLK